MREYLLDTNVIIGMWKHCPVLIDKLIEEKRISVLKEICEELVVKERKEYKGQELLSERFCKLLPFIEEVDNTHIEKFNKILDKQSLRESKADYHDVKKLSENDLLLIYASYVNKNLMLVTQDKSLFNIAKSILGKERVITLEMLLKNDGLGDNVNVNIKK